MYGLKSLAARMKNDPVLLVAVAFATHVKLNGLSSKLWKPPTMLKLTGLIKPATSIVRQAPWHLNGGSWLHIALSFSLQ